MNVQICSNDYLLKSLQKELLAEEILRVYDFLGFPGGASGKEPTCQCSRHRRCGFDPWVGKIPWRRRIRQPIPIFLPGESPWTEEPGKLQPQGRKELDMTKVTEHTHTHTHTHRFFNTTMTLWKE